MSRRNRSLTKAAAPATALARGTTWTTEQVAAILKATRATAGGQVATALPRLEPMVPFGPGIPLIPAPINPLRPDTGRPEPRAYEYPVTFNLPGFGDRLIPWKVLRDAADMIPLFRRCIEIRKAEVATLDWDVTISAKAVERAQRQDPSSARSEVEKAMRERVEGHIGRLVDFWELPDRRNGHDFIAWASKVLEEYFVLDAIAVYPRLRRDGNIFGLEVLDGTTIKPLLDNDGFRPMPPQPAYQQILYGFPRGEFIADGDGAISGAYPADRLVYKVHNVRSFTPYGLPAVEQALYDGELYLRRMGWLKAEYTDGVMPAGWLLAGEGQAEWSPQMLAEYERQLNDYYAGNTMARQRFRILPWGMRPDDSRTDLGERYRPDYDLHLIKLVAGHFDTTIAELGFTEPGGLGSQGWHEGQADVQDRKATQPTLRRLQSLCTHLMRVYLGAPPELEFRILGLESEDENAADEVAGRRVGQARMTWNEDRDRTGLPRYTFPEADMPCLVTPRGLVFIKGASELAAAGAMVGPATAVPVGTPPEEDGAGASTAKPAPGKPNLDAVKAELLAYRRWLAKRDPAKAGRPFRFEVIDKSDASSLGIETSLAEFVKAEGVAGRAPKVRHWPGWERDLQVAQHWAPILLAASTGLRSARALVADATRAYRRGGIAALNRVVAALDYETAFTPALHGLWTDAFVVGAISARASLSHHGMIVKAATPDVLTIGADWGAWSPGDEIAARQLLGVEGLGDGLAALLAHGGIVLKGISDTRLDELARVLANGLEDGHAPAKIAIAIRAIVDDPKWAYKVAVTETTRAVSAASLLRYTRNGIEAVEWMTALDQRVCPQCSINEDQGAIPIGTSFPDGNDAPPAHPLCRCAIAPAWLSAAEAAAEGVDLGGIGLGATSLVDELAAAQHAAVEAMMAQTHEALEAVLAEAERRAIAAGIRPAKAMLGPSEAEIRMAGALGRPVSVEIRAELMAARTSAAVGRVFMAEAQRITGRTGRDAIRAWFEGSAATAREHAEGLLRGLERFPEADLRGVTTTPLGWGGWDSSSYAAAADGRVAFNNAWTSPTARKDYLKSVARDADRHWHPNGTGSPVAMALHEFGHVLDIETLGEVARSEIKHLVDEQAAADGVTAEELIKFDISRYAASEGRELAAEAFVDVLMNGDQASKLSRDIYDVLVHEYQAGGRVLVATPNLVSQMLAEPAQHTAAEITAMRLPQLRVLARERGLIIPVGARKPDIVALLNKPASNMERAVLAAPVTPLEVALSRSAAEIADLVGAGVTDLANLVQALEELPRASSEAIAAARRAKNPARLVVTLRSMATKRGITVMTRTELAAARAAERKALTEARRIAAAAAKAAREAAAVAKRAIKAVEGGDFSSLSSGQQAGLFVTPGGEGWSVASFATEAQARQQALDAVLADAMAGRPILPLPIIGQGLPGATGWQVVLRGGTALTTPAPGSWSASATLAQLAKLTPAKIRAIASKLGLEPHVAERLIQERVDAMAREKLLIGKLPSRGAPSLSDLQALAAEPKPERFINGRYGSGGLRAEVTDFKVTPGRSYSGYSEPVSFAGDVTLRGRKVGRFIRDYDTTGPNGEMVAHHAYLQLDEGVRGTGFAEEFNANLIDWYKRSGIGEVHLSANIDVGGYAWARAGYEFVDSSVAKRLLGNLETIVGDLAAGTRASAQMVQDIQLKWMALNLSKAEVDTQVRAAQALLARAKRYQFGDPQYPSAYELSQVGRGIGQGKDDLWIGKATLLGSYWHAVLYL